MKPFVVAALFWSLGVSLTVAQTTVPSTPGEFLKRKLGESGSGSTGTASTGVKPAAPKTIVIHYVSVSPLRQWSNTEGKTMMARLLAFSAPKEGEQGPVEVIREGKVRFLLNGGKEPIDYPLSNLSRIDQTEIKRIAEAARGREPEEAQENEPRSDEVDAPDENAEPEP